MSTTATDAFWPSLARALEAQGIQGPLGRAEPVAGGCLHDGACVDAGSRRLFIKHNSPDCAAMFAAEAAGLATLAEPGALRVPRPRAHGVAGGRAYLVTEWVDLDGPAAPAALGEALARLHAAEGPHYGYDRDYHLLNHAHLFGGPYPNQAHRVIERLRAEIGA